MDSATYICTCNNSNQRRGLKIERKWEAKNDINVALICKILKNIQKFKKKKENSLKNTDADCMKTID